VERPTGGKSSGRSEGESLSLRSTRRGSLIVQTEAARRMMARLRDMKDAVAEPVKDAVSDDPAGDAAPAGR
jgi:hypothetical protein